MFTHYLKSER